MRVPTWLVHLLFILFGAVVGICAFVFLRGVAVAWATTFAAMADLATVVAVCVGGAWTYLLFVRQRLGDARANVEHGVQIEGLQGGSILLRIAVKINNVGSVLIRPRTGRVVLSRVDPRTREESAEGGTPTFAHGWKVVADTWPEVARVELDFSKDEFTLEPGESETYYAEFIVDPALNLVQVQSYVDCGAQYPDQHWDETSLHRIANSLEADV